jgi:Uncharacterized protein conserved in bacteria
MLPRRLLLTLLPSVLLIGGVVSWLLPGVVERSDVPEAERSPLEAEFDYYIDGMRRFSFEADGRTKHRLEATRVEHYPVDDHAELEQPSLLWYQTDEAPWMLRANAGTLHGTGSEAEDWLELRDDVVLTRPLQDGSTLTARSSRVDAMLATREFSTDQAVTLDTADMHMDSIGMRGNLLDNYVELLDDVRGRHEPKTR